MNKKDYRIAIIGQGYVGLPLAIEFAMHFPVIGFDINCSRIEELNRGEDHTKEADLEKLENVLQLAKDNQENDMHTIGYIASADTSVLEQANIYIVTVPTPIDEFNAPDLRPLKSASEMIAKVIHQGDIVIYESTVFPGCTEEVCIPII